VGDVLEQPAAVASADIVVLNRVVCCSPDGVRLTGVAARLAGRMLLLSFPRDRFSVRVVVRVMNATLWLMGRSFRVFLHPRASLYRAAQAEGLVVAETGRGIAWEFAAFRRAPQSDHKEGFIR
jgi:magnesium-protoporphyrin O-methyltransferase